jgi:hypothetical protein
MIQTPPGKAPATIKTPAGYKDIGEFLEEARERYQQDVDFDRENREEAYIDLRFLAGEQWDPDDVTARKGRPCLTINTLPQYVAQVVGDIRINQPSIKVRPAEDADQPLADVREGLIRAIQYESKASQVYVNAGQNQVGCGIGNFRVSLDYAADDVFDRDIRIKAIPNPFAVVWDSARTEATGRDAGHCFITDEMPRKLFEERYPDKSPADLGSEFLSTLQTGGWINRDIVRVTEYWVMKDKPAEIAMLQSGEIKELTADNRDALMPQVATNGKGAPMVRKTTKKVACMYLITGFDILEEPVEYPISRLPVFRVPGWEINTGHKTIRWGLVRHARDPARLRNYWRSVMAEKLALAPRQQWIIQERSAGDADEFRNAANSGDTVLTYSGEQAPQRMEPPPIEAALMQEAALNAQDIKDVTGLHDASLGARSNETSGKAIMARQREGDVATYIYQDNLKDAIGECGRVVEELIPVVFDTARTVRVLGADEQQTIQRVNDPMDPNSIDLAKGKYDVVVDVGPSYTTKRVEAAESMMQFVQAVPMAAQAAADLIAKAQDWPLADEIGDRLSKMLPPGLVQPDPAKMSPEEQQQYAMQQQQAQAQAQEQAQIQRQGAQLNLAELAAKVDKTRAEATHRMAEAQRLGSPAAVDPQMQQYEYGLKAAELRLAEANADEAQANAGIAFFNLSQLTSPAAAEANAIQAQAQAHQAAAQAVQAHIQTASDLHDLAAKPLDTAHQVVDLQNKLNPPEPDQGASDPSAAGQSG